MAGLAKTTEEIRDTAENWGTEEGYSFKSYEYTVTDNTILARYTYGGRDCDGEINTVVHYSAPVTHYDDDELQLKLAKPLL